MSFSADGGRETITVSSNNSWSIKTHTYSWGHLTRNGNNLELVVDANSSTSQRTDYFVLTADGVDKRVNITQGGYQRSNNLQLYGSTRSYVDNAIGLKDLANSVSKWNECRLGALTEAGSGVVVYKSNGYSCTGSSQLRNTIKGIHDNSHEIKSIAVTNSGYYCVVYGRNGWSGVVPDQMKLKLNHFNSEREDIYCVSISENGNFVIVTDKHLYASNGADDSDLTYAKNKYGHIKYVCITNKGFIAVCSNGIYYHNIPLNLEERLKVITFSPDKVVFTDSGTYLITNEKGAYSYNM